MKKTALFLLVLLAAVYLPACGNSVSQPVNTIYGTYDDMVAYFVEKGYIAADCSPVDMLTTEGYVTDNTGGSIPCAPFADRAEDYDGLWLMWWDSSTPSEAYESCFANIAMNDGTVVYQGGAATIKTAAYNGNFAIAFADGYAQADTVLENFQSLPRE